MTAALVDAYKASPTVETVEAFATKFGKTQRSIIAKLSTMGVYAKKEYLNKRGEKPVQKEETASAIGKILGFTDSEVASLEKANKTAINKIFSALANSRPL